MPVYLIDANLPRWFKPWSGSEYVFADDFGPSWQDSEVWRYASLHKLTIVTKDADFLHRSIAAASPPRVIHFRTGNLTMRRFHEIVAPIWNEVCLLSAANPIVQVFPDRIEVVQF